MRNMEAFESVGSAVAEVADNWQSLEHRPEDAGKLAAYLDTMDVVYDLAKPSIDEELRKGFTEYGISLIGGYAFIGAFIANRQGMEKDQLVNLMDHPKTLDTLLIPAYETNKIALHLEQYMGINPNRPMQDECFDEYSIEDGALKLTRPVALRQKAHLTHARDTGEHPTVASESHRCPAAKLGTIKPIYDAVMKIAAKDPSLFDATLALDRENSAAAVTI